MRHKIISVSRAKTSLLELARSVDEDGDAYILVRDGQPVAALVSMLEYEAFLETSDVLADAASRASLNRALDDVKHGRLWKRDQAGRWTRATRPASKKKVA